MQLCQSFSCLAVWYEGQAANNTFALLGAMSTFAVAVLALRLSRRDAIRTARMEDRQARISAYQAWAILEAHANRLASLQQSLAALLEAEGAIVADLVKELDLYDRPIAQIQSEVMFAIATLKSDCSKKIVQAFTIAGSLRIFIDMLRQAVEVESIDQARERIEHVLERSEATRVAMNEARKAVQVEFQDDAWK